MTPSTVALYFVVAWTSSAPAQVRYVTKVVSNSWEPIAVSAVEAMVEERAVVALTQGGFLALEKSSYAELKERDYIVLFDGRFVEEAEKFSVYMTFGPGKKNDLPSFHVSETIALGGLTRVVMQERIEQLATQAAERLKMLLAPQLAQASLAAPKPIEEPVTPWEWGPIELKKLQKPSKLLLQLLDVRNEDHVRLTALNQIAEDAFEQNAARHALETCLLRDPSPDIRAGCARALFPVARTSVPTQRILLHAMRVDVDERVLDALFGSANAFVGLSRKEAIETWLQLVASSATPARPAQRAAELLAKEGDVPNLDLAVAKCLDLEAFVTGRRQACAQYLLKVIPSHRRLPVVLRYFERVRVFDLGERLVFEDVLEATTGKAGKLPDLVVDLLLDVAHRSAAGDARRMVLYPLRRAATPTAMMVERVLPLVHDPALAVDALRLLGELCRTNPALMPLVADSVRRMRKEAHFLTSRTHQDPLEEMEKLVGSLERTRP